MHFTSKNESVKDVSLEHGRGNDRKLVYASEIFNVNQVAQKWEKKIYILTETSHFVRNQDMDIVFPTKMVDICRNHILRDLEDEYLVLGLDSSFLISFLWLDFISYCTLQQWAKNNSLFLANIFYYCSLQIRPYHNLSLRLINLGHKKSNSENYHLSLKVFRSCLISVKCMEWIGYSVIFLKAQ